ncbi:hypothetical protein ACYPKM_01575 [Pseudomonas aeruginosa]
MLNNRTYICYRCGAKSTPEQMRKMPRNPYNRYCRIEECGCAVFISWPAPAPEKPEPAA